MAISKDQTENKVLLTLFNSDLTRAGESAQANTDGTNVTFGEIQAIPGVETSENDTDFKVNTKVDITIPVDGTNTKYTYKYRRLKLSGFAKVKNINTEDGSITILKHNTEGNTLISDENYKAKVVNYLKDTLGITSDTTITVVDVDDLEAGTSTITARSANSKLFNDGITFKAKVRDDNFGVYTYNNDTKEYFKKDASATGFYPGLDDLYIPKGMTEIPENWGGDGFRVRGKLYLHDNITSIGNNAFKNVSLYDGKLITSGRKSSLPTHLATIGSNAFGSISRADGNVVLPDSLTSIAENAFGSTSGFDVNSVNVYTLAVATKISTSEYDLVYVPNKDHGPADTDHNEYSEFTFNNQKASNKLYLTASEIASNSEALSRENFNNKIKTLVLSKNVTEIKENIFSHITLTDKLDLTNITTIGANAFTGASIERVDFDDSLTTVGTDAFKDSVVAHVYVDTDAQITSLKALLPHLASSDWHSKAGGKEIESGGLKYGE